MGFDCKIVVGSCLNLIIFVDSFGFFLIHTVEVNLLELLFFLDKILALCLLLAVFCGIDACHLKYAD